MEIPQINKTYNYFDDGKIWESRRLPVVIREIIPFEKIDSKTLSIWKDEVENCDWLYAKSTDFFIKGMLELSDDSKVEIIFVRTIDNRDGWFSLGWWAGRLDVDGSLEEISKARQY